MSKKNYDLVTGFVVLTSLIIVIAASGYLVSRPKPLNIQGQVESSEYRISGKLTSRVERLAVKVGDKVTKGDTLAIMSAPEVNAKLSEVEAIKAAASAMSSEAEHGARKEQIQAAYQVWQQALVQVDVMKKSFDRVQKLYDQKVVSAQKYDETKARYDASVAQAKAAESQYALAVNGARKEDKAAAQAKVAQAEGAVKEVDAYLSDLVLTSPCDGFVTDIHPEDGELVTKGSPVMTVTDLSDVWFTFNVREDNMSGLAVGSPIKVKIPILDNKEIPATVTYVNLRDTYATWKASTDRDGYDIQTFEVRATPDKPLEGIRAGMTAIIVDPATKVKL